METDADDFAATYDWVDNPPWGGAAEQAHRLGIDVDAAHAQLVALYPPHVCRKMVSDGEGPLISVLLLRKGSWIPACAEMLRLGADLAACPGWDSDPTRLSRLRCAAEFDGVRFEIALRAAARRKGLRAEFSPPPESGPKSADLAIWDSDAYVVLELKWPQVSQRDANLDCLHEAVTHSTMRSAHAIGPHQLVLHLSPSAFTAANTTRSEQFTRTFADPIAQRLSALYAIGRSIVGTRHSLEEAGDVEFLPAEFGVEFAIAGPEEALINKSGTRILRELREADKQLGRYKSDVRVAVVLISSQEFQARDASQLIAAEIERDKSVLSNVDVAVVVNPPTPYRAPVVCATALRSSHLKFLRSTWMQAVGDASRIAGGAL